MAEQCPYCETSFAGPVDLTTHLKKAHHGGTPAQSLSTNPAAFTPGYTCAFCGRTFDTPEKLAEHDLHPHRYARPRWRPVPG